MALVTPRSMWKAPSGNWYPLMDAEAAVYATPNDEDRVCGVPGDPSGCVIVQAFKRAVSSPDVLIGETMAYVVMKRDGEWIALRFAVPTATRRVLDTYDKTHVFPEGALELKVAPESNKLASKRARDKRLRERHATMGHKRQKRGAPRSNGRNAAPLARTLVVKRHTSD